VFCLVAFVRFYRNLTRTHFDSASNFHGYLRRTYGTQ
jgi:hypothetical protein